MRVDKEVDVEETKEGGKEAKAARGTIDRL